MKIEDIRQRKRYYRGTDNRNEPRMIADKTIKPSVNHLTGNYEKGLSVSDVPDVEKYFAYMYEIEGTEIGEGSDGEPLLDLDSLKFIRWINRPKR